MKNISMKIGILTFHDTTNFGSLLQTYGLYRAIVNLGYDCEVIDYQCKNIADREIPKPFRFTLNPKNWLLYILLGRHRPIKYKALSQFLTNNMRLSEKCGRYNVAEVCKKYDKIFVGSDIVWGLDITDGDLTYFIDFEQDANKKYAFSSSIGNPWKEDEKKLVEPLLRSFNRIAVREEESADWVEELIRKRPQVVCDPTMLLNADTWREVTSVKKRKDDYVLVYFDNKNGDCISNAIRYARANNLKVYLISDGISHNSYKTVKPHSLGDFLTLIDNAAFVMTASYHGMLYSLYFNKQFAYFNRAHKSRMNTLSKKLHVADRNGEEYDVMTMNPIDYSIVNKAIEDYRNESTECLKEFLKA